MGINAADNKSQMTFLTRWPVCLARPGVLEFWPDCEIMDTGMARARMLDTMLHNGKNSWAKKRMTAQPYAPKVVTSETIKRR